jgi:hypothetical protein
MVLTMVCFTFATPILALLGVVTAHGGGQHYYIDGVTYLGLVWTSQENSRQAASYTSLERLIWATVYLEEAKLITL